MKKIVKKIIATGLTLAIGTMLLGGCSNKESKKEDSATSNNLTKITVTEPGNSDLWAAAYVAKELGYFKEQGLDVTLNSGQGTAAAAAVVSGEAQIGMFGCEMVMKLNEEGKGTKLIATGSGKYPFVLMGNKNIKTVEELKGKNVSAAGPTSSMRPFVKKALEVNGLDVNDINFVSLDGDSGIISAMESDQVQGTYAYGYTKEVLESKGNTVVVNTYDSKMHDKIVESPTYEMYGVYATDKYIKENTEVVQGFVNAYYKAQKWILSNTSEDYIKLVEKYFPGRDKDLFIKSIDNLKQQGIFSENCKLTETGIEAASKIAKNAGFIKNDITYDKIVDSTFIDKAIKEFK